MKITKNIIKKSFGALFTLALIGCQDMDHPELGDYPTDTGSYTPKDGETLYSAFENKYFINSVTGAPATKVGSPEFGDPKIGTYSYKGATSAYLSYPIKGLFGTTDLSFSFWYKVNATPDRSGIVTVGVVGDTDRKHGLRLFREGSATSQTLKLITGHGTGDAWNDGAAIKVSDSWVHIAVTISATESKIYFDGVLKNTKTFSNPIDLIGCTTMEIASGAPTFDYWGHKSDASLYDDFRVFNKVLTQDEIQALMK